MSPARIPPATQANSSDATKGEAEEQLCSGHPPFSAIYEVQT